MRPHPNDLDGALSTGSRTLTALKSIPVTRARGRLHRLVDEVAKSGEPVHISGLRADAVLVSADDWRATHETLYLLSAPGMRQSIQEGLRAPLDECGKSPGR